MTCHPRLLLERAEIRYLDANGWIILSDTLMCCCAPEDSELKNPMTMDDAVLEQKKRDVK
jgi:hypothetical protein